MHRILNVIARSPRRQKQSLDHHDSKLSRDDNRRRFHRRQTILSWLTVFLLVLLQVQFLPTFSVTDLAVIASRQQTEKQSQDQSEVQANYGKLPLAFEPNQGQVDGAASFLVHHGQATTYFDGASTTTSVGDDHITMSLDGANTPNFTGTDQLESKTNYFIGNDKSKWHSDIPNYKQLLAKNVYPGIDLKYYGTNSQLEHDFIVSPGTDYKQIAFHFDGQQDLSLDTDGNLVLKLANEELHLNAPIIYQQTTNTKHTISSQFELNDNKVTVVLNGDYDHSQSLIIDPTLALIYSTYLGGSGTDLTNGITVDASGNAYLTGVTSSTNFPTSSPYQGSNGGSSDVFVTKVNAAGSALTYSTYLGGTAIDLGYSIAVDVDSNAFVVGSTGSTNFPTSSPLQASNQGSDDAFITKFDPSGSALIYSTYLGGSSADNVGVAPGGMGIVVDSADNVYITGSTRSTDFPMISAYQAVNGGGLQDTFVSKINPSGSTLIYSTYLGGSGTEWGADIGLDLSGDAFVVGRTNSTNFPTASPFQGSNAGGTDAFITQLTEHSVNLTATVDPTLTFTVGSTSCALGALSVSQTQQCTYALTASTNGTSGYTISYLPVATLTSGGNTITALSALTASTLNTEQFGINLRANTAVGSHTAGAFGADVSGGSGTVASAYNTVDSFKLVAAGDTVSSSTSPSLASTYTVSTIANIGATTEAGAYTTTLTYNIVAGY